MNLLRASVAAVLSIGFCEGSKGRELESISRLLSQSTARRTYVVDLGLRDDHGGHGTEHRQQTLGSVKQLPLLRRSDNIANLVLDASGDLVELILSSRLAGRAGLLVLLSLATLDVALDELEVNELLDGAVAGNEDELGEREGGSSGGELVGAGGRGRSRLVVLHVPCDRAGDGGSGSGSILLVGVLLILVVDLHRILLLDILGGVAVGTLRAEDSHRHVAKDSRAESVGLVAESVNCVDRLLGHREPVGRRAVRKTSFESRRRTPNIPFLVRRRVLDGAGETSEDGAVHGETDRDVVEGSCDARREE